MPITNPLPVKDLKLDLENFRTVHQPDERHAANALITISPKYFWGLMESLLEDGYSPTENIIVIKTNGGYVVREGNRRIASLKIIYGLIKNIDLPDHITERIDQLTNEWKTNNREVPCAIYSEKDEEFVDKIVARTHGKGQTAGRDPWTAVARARHARDHNNMPDPALDLLEAYLQQGKNLSSEQAERWSGDYPITVLAEAMPKLAVALGCQASADVISLYPGKQRKVIEEILHDIGLNTLGFRQVRATSSFWGAQYDLKPPAAPTSKGTQTISTVSGPGATAPGPVPAPGSPSPSPGTMSLTSGGTSKKTVSSKTLASNDPKAVRRKLKVFTVRGTGRDKIVTLVNEIKRLKHEEFPHAFLFLLRSIFELSAKAYCASNPKAGISTQKNGMDRKLVDVLRDIVNCAVQNDQQKKRVLHGAMTEFAKHDGILSATSLNQLVHNPSFSVAPADICIVFGNVFPLLEEMNG